MIALFVALLTIPTLFNQTVSLNAGEVYTSQVTLSVGDTFECAYKVKGGYGSGIRFGVRNPDGSWYLKPSSEKPEGNVRFIATVPGTYEIILDNKHPLANNIRVVLTYNVTPLHTPSKEKTNGVCPLTILLSLVGGLVMAHRF